MQEFKPRPGDFDIYRDTVSKHFKKSVGWGLHMVAQACNPNTQETGRRITINSRPVWASYTVRSCLKRPKKEVVGIWLSVKALGSTSSSIKNQQ